MSLSRTNCYFSSNWGTSLLYDLLGTSAACNWLVRGHQRKNWQMSSRVKQPQKFYFLSLQIKIIASFPLTATQTAHPNKTINCGENSGPWSLPVDHSVASIWTLREYTGQTPRKELPGLYWTAVEPQVIAQILCYKVTFVCSELTPHSTYGLTIPRKKT